MSTVGKSKTPADNASVEEKNEDGSTKWKNVKMVDGKYRYSFIAPFVNPEDTDPDFIDLRSEMCFRDVRIADAKADSHVDRVFYLAVELSGLPDDVMDRVAYADVKLMSEIVEEISAKNSALALRFMEGAAKGSKKS